LGRVEVERIVTAIKRAPNTEALANETFSLPAARRDQLAGTLGNVIADIPVTLELDPVLAGYSPTIFAELLRNFAGRFGRVFEYYNVIHTLVQYDFVRVGRGNFAAEHSCMRDDTRLRPDLCSVIPPGVSAPIGFAEVKFNHAPSVMAGGRQLDNYVREFNRLAGRQAYYRACTTFDRNTTPGSDRWYPQEREIPINLGLLNGSVRWRFYCAPGDMATAGVVGYSVHGNIIPPNLPAWEDVRADLYAQLASLAAVIAVQRAGLQAPAPSTAPAPVVAFLRQTYEDLGVYGSMVTAVPTHYIAAYGRAAMALATGWRFLFVGGLGVDPPRW
jgi:hypothetical protein